MPDRTVTHPPHYNSHPSGLECWDLILDMRHGDAAVIKYLWRWESKDAPLQDLRKALEYLSESARRSDKPSGGVIELTTVQLRTLYRVELAADPLEKRSASLAAMRRGFWRAVRSREPRYLLASRLRRMLDHVEQNGLPE